MKAKILTLTIFFSSLCNAGQFCETNNISKDEPQSSFYDSLLRGEIVTLRQSSQDKNTNDEAALILWTENEKKKDTIAVDAALAFSVCSGQFTSKLGGLNRLVATELKPVVEYHRSTVTSKEADTFSAGLTYELIASPPPPTNAPKNPDDIVKKDFFEHFLSLSTNYKHDKINLGEGFQTGVSYSPIGGFLKTSIPLREWNLSNSYWQPSFSLQYENANGIKPDSSGNVSRGKTSITFVYAPFQQGIINLTTNYSGWWNFSRSGPFEQYDQYQSNFTTTLNWNLLFPPETKNMVKKANVALALQYVKGDDPEKGKLDQSYTQLALKFRL